MTEKRRSLGAQNKRAWDALYASTDTRIWGDAPTTFLRDSLRNAVGGLPENFTAVDAGTGEGRNLELLLELTSRVHACDASRNALKKIPEHVRKRVQTHRCDLGKLPFADRSVDLVLTIDVIETLPRPTTILREFARVLRPGGVLLCNIPGPDDEIAGVAMRRIGDGRYLFHGRFFYQFLNEEAAIELLNDCGFNVRDARLHTWTEEAHPNFRESEHAHTSRVFVAERVA